MGNEKHNTPLVNNFENKGNLQYSLNCRIDLANEIELHENGVLYLISIKRLSGIKMLKGHEYVEIWIEGVMAQILHVFERRGKLFRVSDNEMGILFTDYQDSYINIAQTIRSIINSYKRELTLNTYIGVMPFRSTSKSADEIIRMATIAMTLNRLSETASLYHCYDQSKWGYYEKRLVLELELLNAIEREEMYVVFQPIIHSYSKQVAFEALVRWHSPVHGVVTPLEFIPIAEDMGIIDKVTQFVTRSVVVQLKNYPVIDYIAINLSSKLFENLNWYQNLKAEFRNICPSRIQFELTESFFIEPSHHHFIQMLQEEGHKIYIDDFGTGYSSIHYLIQLGIDGVKLDRLFVKYSEQPNYVLFIKKTVEMAKALNLKIIVEGIEKAQQKYFFTQIGCDAIQGYLEAKPMQVKAIPKYLAESLLKGSTR